jgi:adenine/guanine phosphoribosyltransferase-like PRPP-binding protein
MKSRADRLTNLETRTGARKHQGVVVVDDITDKATVAATLAQLAAKGRSAPGYGHLIVPRVQTLDEWIANGKQ